MRRKNLFLFIGAVMSFVVFTGNANAQAGSLSITLDSANPFSSVIATNSADVEFVKFKFTATDEDINITSIKLTASASSSANLINIKLFDGGTQLGWTVASPFSNTVTFSNYSLIKIPANSSKILTVKASVTGSGSANLGIQNPSTDVSAVGQTSVYTIYPTPSTPVFGNVMTISDGSTPTVAVPDLTITDFSWTPLNPTVSQTDPYIYFNFTVKNIGNTSVTIPTNTEYALYKGSISAANKVGAVIVGTGVITLEPNQSQAYSNRSTMQSPNIRAQAGTFDLIMVADATNLVQEANETNNSITKPIVIGATTNVITPSIKVIYPNGGENLEIGKTYNITWQSTGDINGIIIYLTDANGAVWATNLVNVNGNPGTASWNIPSHATPASYKISIVGCSAVNCTVNDTVSSATELARDYSDSSFNISAATPIVSNSIKVVSPNGGEAWQVGQTYPINWTTTGYSTDALIQISLWDTRYSYDTAITKAVNTGNYNFTVPSSLGSTSGGILGGNNIYKIRTQVYSTAFQEGVTTDSSDASFSITEIKYPIDDIAKSIKVTSPNGGEKWEKGKTYNITWNSKGYDKVRVFGECENYGILGPILDVPSGATGGSYSYTVPAHLADQSQCKVQVAENSSMITNIQNGINSDYSDTSFSVVAATTITPSITVLSPNGGESWTKGTTQTIKWRDNMPIPLCPEGAPYCSSFALKQYDIKLLATSLPQCISSIDSSIIASCGPFISPYTIANRVNSSSYNSSYNWAVGNILDSNIIPDGAYTIQICQTGTTICDSSDSYFKITTGIPNVVPIKDGSVVKIQGAPDVYFIKDGQKVKINSPKEFDEKGYKWDQIQTVQADLLSQIAELKAQIAQLRDELKKTGTLLKAQGGADVYVVKDGKRVKINSPEEFNKNGYKWDKIQEVSVDELSQIPTLTVETASVTPIVSNYPNSTLIKAVDGNDIYVIINGKKRRIPDPATFNKFGYKWDQIKKVEAGDLLKISDDTAVSISAVPQAMPASSQGVGTGFLVKSIDNPTVYYITQTGMKKSIPSIEVFNSYPENRFENVKIVPQSQIDGYPTANLFKQNSDAKVYFIEDGKKKWVKTEAAFTKRGFNFGKVSSVNKTELDTYPDGEVID